jgi:hypothetical protein
MNHKEIISRAWKILWGYKTLWIFGIILSLTTVSFSDRVWQFSDKTRHIDTSGISGRSPFLGQSFQEGIKEINRGFDALFNEVIPKNVTHWIVTIAILTGLILIFLFIVRLFLKYISQTAIIKMVDEYETSEIKKTWREGFKTGWSPLAWRLFLIDLIINLPTVLILVVLMVVVFAPLLLWSTHNTAAGIFGSVVATGLFVLFVFLVIIVGVAITLLKQFFYRACVLENLRTGPAIFRGFRMVRHNLKDVGLMWLIIMGVKIGYGIAIIPIAFIMVITAGLTGGVFGLVAGGISNIFTNGSLPIIVGVTVGIPIFFLVLIAPLAFLGGLKETFISTNWTLTYRELRSLQTLASPVEEDVSAESLTEHTQDEDLPIPE